MSRNRDKEPLLDLDPEPERTLRKHLQQVKVQHSGRDLTKLFEQETKSTDMVAKPNNEADARKILGDFTTPTTDFYGRSISIPTIRANNFELKPQLVSLLQQNCKFHGLSLEDPHQFLSEFLQNCDTIKTNGVDPEVYRFMLFPFAVRDRAKIWLDSQPKESLDSWKKLVNAFLAKFFPPQKMNKLRVEVQTFKQKEGIFYDGLSKISKMSLDHSAGGSLHLKKMLVEARELIEMVANNQFMYISDRNPVNNGVAQKKRVLKVDTLNVILAQNKILTQQVNMISQHLTGSQAATGSTLEASYEGEAYDPYQPSREEDQQKPQQGFNNNQGGRTHNRFNNRPLFPSSQEHLKTPRQSLSELVTIVSNLFKTTHSFITETRSSIRNMEVQVGQLSKRIPETSPNTLPSNTEVNPKEECKAIITEAEAKSKEDELALNANKEDLTGRSTPKLAPKMVLNAIARRSTPNDPPILELNASKEVLTGHSIPTKAKQLALNASKGIQAGRSMPKETQVLALNATIGIVGNPRPTENFPIEELLEPKVQEEPIEVPLNAWLKIIESGEYSSSDEEEETREEQVVRYLGIMMKLNAKLFGTEPLEEEPTVLTKELNALVQHKLPQKKPDPGRFLIPCTIAARISLEMADKFMKKAYGLVEDVLVKVEDLYLPADFIILDTGEEEDESIILRRPFLATAKAVIDVDKRELVLQLNEDCLVFKVRKPHSTSAEGSTIYKHEVLHPSLSVQSYAEAPDTNSKFSVGQPLSITGNKDNPVIPHTMCRILSLEHVKLIHESIGKKFTVSGKILSPYPSPTEIETVRVENRTPWSRDLAGVERQPGRSEWAFNPHEELIAGIECQPESIVLPLNASQGADLGRSTPNRGIYLALNARQGETLGVQHPIRSK
ncbi:Retrotransposon gag protein [Arachis hypogaea]|nr:Retrotransposon gag protein [Arachis hypogaea]